MILTRQYKHCDTLSLLPAAALDAAAAADDANNKAECLMTVTSQRLATFDCHHRLGPFYRIYMIIHYLSHNNIRLDSDTLMWCFIQLMYILR